MVELGGMLTLEQMKRVLSEFFCAFGSSTGKKLIELVSLVLLLSKQGGGGMSSELPPKCGKKKSSSINKFSVFTIFTSLQVIKYTQCSLWICKRLFPLLQL